MRKSAQKSGDKGKVYKTCFWKGLVSTDPEPEYDENGDLIETPEEHKQVSNFSMIKRMMRLKAKQDAVPESEKVVQFIPQVHPEFVHEGKDKYYFDMKNNEEHYQLLTNDMTDEQF